MILQRYQNEQFLFLPLRSSHSSKGHFLKNKTYSTVSDSVEVGCNYSGDHREGTGTFTDFQECSNFPDAEA